MDCFNLHACSTLFKYSVNRTSGSLDQSDLCCLYKLEQAGEILVDNYVMIEKGRLVGGEIRVQG